MLSVLARSSLMQSKVDGVLVNRVKIPSRNFPGRFTVVLQVLISDGIRIDLVDIHDYSRGGFNCLLRKRVRLLCDVVFYKGMKQYHYRGGVSRK